jgi:hypothetical protein
VSVEERRELEEFTNELLKIADEQSVKEIADKKIKNSGQPFRVLSSTGLDSLAQDQSLVDRLEAAELGRMAQNASKDRKRSVSLDVYLKQLT